MDLTTTDFNSSSVSSLTFNPGPFSGTSGTVIPNAQVTDLERQKILREIGELEEAALERKRMIGYAEPAKLVLSPPPALLRLDLGCGNGHAAHVSGTPVPGCKLCEGFEGADFADLKGIKWPRTNLFRFPWPWADDSVDEVWCLPAGEKVTVPGGKTSVEDVRSGDLLLGATGWTKVQRCLRRFYSGLAYRISVGSSVVIVTEEHPVGTPTGWIKANQVRKGMTLFEHTPHVEGTHSIDIFDVRRTVARFPMLTAGGSMRVVEGNSSAAEANHDVCLSDLPDEEGTDRFHNEQKILESRDGNRPCKLAALGQGLHGHILSSGNSDFSEDFYGPIDDKAIRVRHRELNLDLRGVTDVEVDRAFSVNDPCNPGDVRLSHVTSVEEFFYEGVVYNFVTEDSTFFAGDLLTHNCSHFVEHVPNCYWNPGHDSIHETYTAIPEGPESQDLFFRFFDELWRVMKHDAVATVIVPALKSDRAFQDPTHRQFISEPRFFYLNRDARKGMGLGHYGAKCHFAFEINHTVPEVETTKSPEASAMRHQNYWNATHDHVARLKAIKREPEAKK